VRANGGLRGNRAGGNVSTVCAGQAVGLEEIDAGVWTLDDSPLNIGRFAERPMNIADAFGRLKRTNVSPMSPDLSVTDVPGRSNDGGSYGHVKSENRQEQLSICVVFMSEHIPEDCLGALAKVAFEVWMCAYLACYRLKHP
jgi:hypothetical protein